MIQTQYYQSPIGEFILGAHKGTLCLLDYRHRTTRRRIDERIQKGLQTNYRTETTDLLEHAIKQLKEYLAGQRTHFDLPLQLVGTPFQQRVWQALQTIPYGETRSYGELAQELRQPKAVRAVAAANGANALALIIPCHRVIKAHGKLGGYAGGLPAKRQLLKLEQQPNLFTMHP